MSDGNFSASSASQASTPRAGSAFLTLALSQVCEDLFSLYKRIACEKGRVEIVGGDGLCDCVLISKAELDGLEQAIELLSDGDGVKALRDTLAQFASTIDPQPTSV